MEEWMFRLKFSWTGHYLEASGQFHASAALPPAKIPSVHLTGGSIWAIVGLSDVEKRKFLTLRGLELRPLCHPIRSRSLYRLCCPYFKRHKDRESQINLVQTPFFFFSKVHFNITLPHLSLLSSHFPSGFPIKTCIHSYRFTIAAIKVKVFL
jgi:hypothetical protein